MYERDYKEHEILRLPQPVQRADHSPIALRRVASSGERHLSPQSVGQEVRS